MVLGRADVLVPPTELELALDMALPGRLTLAAVKRRLEVGAVVLFGADAVPFAAETVRAEEAVVGLAAVALDEA